MIRRPDSLVGTENMLYTVSRSIYMCLCYWCRVSEDKQMFALVIMPFSNEPQPMLSNS